MHVAHYSSVLPRVTPPHVTEWDAGIVDHFLHSHWTSRVTSADIEPSNPLTHWYVVPLLDLSTAPRSNTLTVMLLCGTTPLIPETCSFWWSTTPPAPTRRWYSWSRGSSPPGRGLEHWSSEMQPADRDRPALTIEGRGEHFNLYVNHAAGYSYRYIAIHLT